MSNKIIPKFPEFADICYELYKEIREALSKEQPEISEHSPGFMFGYRKSLNLSISRLNNNLILKGCYGGENLIVSPIGRNQLPETFFACVKYIKEVLKTGRIGAIPKTIAMKMKGFGFDSFSDRDDFDYIYSVKELTLLSGEKFHAKKNLVNGFIKRYSYEFKPLDSVLIPECLLLHQRWCDLKSCKEDSNSNAEDRMVVELLHNFDNWKLFGGAILINGKVQAFTILEELNANTAVGHVEKANTEYRGIYQAINQFAAEKLLQKYKFVNREQDVGEPGLRKAKLSYNPVSFAEKYYIQIS
ncbi:MAG: phosphatidylglycerol lysyltransferase domain-containing protein [Candidatus Firestonebacteria bacterium]|nr:phosphatidylglycerol lysyltransferase domain-containing protein [Candidatus Firestonebacteria bacterium]